MSHFNQFGRLLPKALAVVLVALCLVSAATAQQYRTDPVDEKARQRFGAKATQWARDSAAYAADKASFDEYFQRYYFPAMTRDTPNGLAELGKLRADLIKKFLWDSSNETLKRDLTGMAFKAMGRIVLSQQPPPYHPAVRYNAILVIGMLDEQYAMNARPPKPLPAATKALTQIVDRAATSDTFPPPVVLGALIGLERHAKYHANVAPDAVAAMSTALLKFVNREKRMPGLDADAQDWLRLRAASAVANLGSVGEKNAVSDALLKLVSDAKSLDDRCLAAALLGKLNYKEAKIDGPAATAALFKLADDLSTEELKRAEDFEQMGGTSAELPRMQAIMRDGTEEEYDPYPRSHVLARLVNLRTGLNAVKLAVPEDSQMEIDAVLAAIKPVIEAASNNKIISLRVADLVRDMHVEITRLVGTTDEAAEDEADFDAGEPAPASAPDATPPAAAEAPPVEGAPSAEVPAAAQPEAPKN